MSKIKLEFTKAQFSATVDMVDTISTMVGCGDDDAIWVENVRLFDRMMKTNGYKRNFK